MRLISPFFIGFCVFLLAAVSYAGKIFDDFDDGDFEGWERSPQNKNNDKISWEVVNGEVVFDPGGQPWQMALSQLNFVGAKNVEDWEDYEFQVEIMHTMAANWPGGIRGHVDLKTGAHYAVWIYPGDGMIRLYKGPVWDINTGIVKLGEAPYKVEINKFHTYGIKFEGDKISVSYDGKVIIEANDNQYKKGTVALCVQDKIVHYDNAVITGKQIPNLNMSPVQPEDKLAVTWGKLKSSP
jgi:hypothetical protein